MPTTTTINTDTIINTIKYTDTLINSTTNTLINITTAAKNLSHDRNN